MKKLLLATSLTGILLLGACGNNDEEPKKDTKVEKHDKKQDKKKEKKTDKVQEKQSTEQVNEETSSIEQNTTQEQQENTQDTNTTNQQEQAQNEPISRQETTPQDTDTKDTSEQAEAYKKCVPRYYPNGSGLGGAPCDNMEEVEPNYQMPEQDTGMNEQQLEEYHRNKTTTHDESQMEIPEPTDMPE